jgi:hypothetical protein
MSQTNRLLNEVDRRLAEGQIVLDSTVNSRDCFESVVDPTLFSKWLAGCRNLLRMLGTYASPWSDCFEESAEYYNAFRARTMFSTLQAIKEAITNQLLIDIKQIVIAETFNNLLEQAEYLSSERYFLAAGVLARAILEENLREWCINTNCLPLKDKPTLSDYNVTLYKSSKYNISVMKHVESMIAIGNNAAHNKLDLCSGDVERLLRDVKEFLGRFIPV